MGQYINIGNMDFARVRNGEYIDKSSVIQVINDTLDTEFCYSCVTRCRRFGKSLTAKMLNAYYDKSCDSRHLFQDLAIAKMPSFEKHLNKYPTIFVDMTYFTTEYRNDTNIVNIIKASIKEDIHKAYPDVTMKDTPSLMDALFAVADSTKERFMMIID